jgi:hypothetical protein
MWQQILELLGPVQWENIVELVLAGPNVLPRPMLAVLVCILESQICSQTRMDRSLGRKPERLDCLLRNRDEGGVADMDYSISFLDNLADDVLG